MQQIRRLTTSSFGLFIPPAKFKLAVYPVWAYGDIALFLFSYYPLVENLFSFFILQNSLDQLIVIIDICSVRVCFGLQLNN